MPNNRLHDLVVIGAGPAGAGAAVQASLYGMRVAVFEPGAVGGRLRLARRVDNFPWMDKGRPDGRQLAEGLRTWLARRRIPVLRGRAEAVGLGRGRFRVQAGGNKYYANIVIICTGLRPRRWRVRGGAAAADLMAEDWTQVPKAAGARVAIVGGGEVALDQACSLADRGAEVTLVMRSGEPRAYPGLVAEAKRLGVGLAPRTTIVELARNGHGVTMMASDGRKLDADYIIPAIGFVPQRPEITPATRGRLGRGLYLAGDVAQPTCRQAAIALGDGVRAAMMAYQWMREQR